MTKYAAWSHLLKKSLMENFIFCALIVFFSSSDGSSITSGIRLNHLKRSDFDEWYIELASVKVDGKFVTSSLNTLLTC